MDIKEELKKTMEWLAEQPDSIFVGQNIVYPENQMYRNLIDIDDNKKFEMPVAEEMQMGVSIGLALGGYVPICWPTAYHESYRGVQAYVSLYRSCRDYET